MPKSHCFLVVLMLVLLSGCDLLDSGNTPDETPVSVRVDAIVTHTPSAEITAEVTPEVTLELTPVPPTETFTPTPTLPPTATPMPFDLESAVSVMSGLCFESVADAAGRVFIMRNAEEHITLYDLAENSELCRRPIIRHPFDFSNGRILVGTWTYGIGCTADHDIVDVVRDDDVKSIRIELRFVTYGDCPYELVRPFWVAFDEAQDYAVEINVEQDITTTSD